MKILCRYPTTDDEEYRPAPFNSENVDDIIDQLNDALMNKYSRRFKKISIDFDDLKFTPDKMSVEAIIYNNGVEKLSGVFEFQPYSDYWDLSDYEQHLATTISKFANSLV